jgi:hypothetical protein
VAVCSADAYETTLGRVPIDRDAVAAALAVAGTKEAEGKLAEAIANQDDWKKRLRELRYLGWEIETFNRRVSSTRVSSFYRLVKSRPWPADPTGDIRRYERERAVRNKA